MNAQQFVAPVADEIAKAATEAERLRCLPGALVASLKEADLFSIYTPTSFGGLGLPLQEALEVVEEVARIDGSTGWLVALGIANDLFVSVLPESEAGELLGDGGVLIAGAPGFNVRATPVDGGYRFFGQWSFNSGAPNATWIAVAAPVFDGERPRIADHGPEMVLAFFRPDEVEIVDTWSAVGLRATGSHDVRADGVFVPRERVGNFAIPDGPLPKWDSVFARLPFFTLLGAVQAPPVCLGLARRAIDEFRQLARTKARPSGGCLSDEVQAQVGLAQAEGLLQSARTYFYEQVRSTWAAAFAGRGLSIDERALMRIATLTAVANSVAAVDVVYRLAGSSSVFESNAINRCWRDVHTAAQHVQVQPERWETAGRVFFGLDPVDPML